MRILIATSILATAIVSAGSANATEVVPYTTTSLTTIDPVQQGRLARARPPSDWSTLTPFPGFINLAVDYTYRTVAVPFAANALQQVYYEVTVDDPDAVVFASAYDGTYDPDVPADHYLGDEGSSGNYFPDDPSYFDIIVPQGGLLTLTFNSVGLPNEDFSYQVSAFSDTTYDEDFKMSSAPEPSSWLLMIAGFGAVGYRVRRVRRWAVATKLS